MKKWLSVILIIAMVFSLSACGSKEDDNSENKSGGNVNTASSALAEGTIPGSKVIIQPESSPSTLVSYVNGNYEIIDNIYEPLLGSKNGELRLADDPEPLLAESWEFSDDKLSCTFNLRKGVKFHNGDDFTSADVVSTYKTLMNDASSIALVGNIDSVEVVDDYTVTFHLKEKDPSFLISVAHYTCGITDHKLTDQYGPDSEKAFVGTGAYSLEQFVQGDKIVLKAFSDYWGGAPQIETVEYQVFQDDNTAYMAFINDELDSLRSQNYMVVPELEKMSHMIQRYNACSYAVWFNTTVKPFDNIKVRQAFQYMIDKNQLNQAMHGGLGYTMDDFFLDDIDWHVEDGPKYEYNPKKGLEMLAKEGYTPAKLPLKFLYAQNSVSKPGMENIQAQLMELGFTVDAQGYDWSTYLTYLYSKDYELCLANGGTTAYDPYTTFAYNFQKGGYDLANLANGATEVGQKVDEFVDEARTSETAAEGIKVFQNATRYLLEHNIGVPLVASPKWIFYSNRINPESIHMDQIRCVLWKYVTLSEAGK